MAPPTKYGMFMEHTYLQPGQPPAGATSSEGGKGPSDTQQADRDVGLNMKATVGRSGKLNDATFDHKFKPLYEGDRYVDPLRAKLMADAEKKKHNIVELPFKAASPMKKSACPGDYYGTGGKIPYIADHMQKQKLKGEIPQQPKGIYTSPAKKGSFGINKTTLSERAGFKGVASEYEYQHDPETLQIERRRTAMAEDRKQRVTELPFKPAAPPKKGSYGVPNTTISKGKGVAGEWEYITGPAAPPGAAGEEKKDLVAFKPAFAFASDRIEHIPYVHDPEVPRLKAAAAKKKEEAARLASTGPWKPPITYKTDMVRSIVKMNLRQRQRQAAAQQDAHACSAVQPHGSPHVLRRRPPKARHSPGPGQFHDAEGGGGGPLEWLWWRWDRTQPGLCQLVHFARTCGAAEHLKQTPFRGHQGVESLGFIGGAYHASSVGM